MTRRPTISRARAVAGFTLLEVMVSMAILAIALSAVFAAEAGSVKMAGRARKLGFASMLVRCKMGEIEEKIAKEGFPAAFDEGQDKCCKDAEIPGFTCKYEIEPVSMPDTMFNPEDPENAEGDTESDKDKDGKDSKSGDSKSGDSKSGDSKSGSSKSSDSKAGGSKPDPILKNSLARKGTTNKVDPMDFLKDPKALLGGGSIPGGVGMGSGVGAAMGMGAGADSESGGAPDMDAIASMAMGFIYPILKPAFESQIRRATVTVMWKEGSAEQKFDVTQYLVAEQPIPMPSTDPNAQNATGTGTGATGTGTGTSNGATTPGTAAQPSLFQPRSNLGVFGTSP